MGGDKRSERRRWQLSYRGRRLVGFSSTWRKDELRRDGDEDLAAIVEEMGREMVRSYLPIRCGIWLRLIANCGGLKNKEGSKKDQKNDLRVRLEVGYAVAGGNI
jgi:hypothetical protein